MMFNKATGTLCLQCSWETGYGEARAAAELGVLCGRHGVGGKGNGRSSFAPPFARNRNPFEVLFRFALLFSKFLLEQGEGETSMSSGLFAGTLPL